MNTYSTLQLFILILVFAVFSGCGSSNSTGPGNSHNPLPGTTYRFITLAEDSLGHDAADFQSDTAVTQLVSLDKTIFGKFGCSEFLENYQSSTFDEGWGRHFVYHFPNGDISVFSTSPFSFYFNDSARGFVRFPSISPSPIILQTIDTTIYYQGDFYHLVLDLRTESAGTASMVIEGKSIFCYRYQLRETGTATKVSDGTTIPGGIPNNGLFVELWYAPELAYFTKRIEFGYSYFQSNDGKIYKNKVLKMTSYNINE